LNPHLINYGQKKVEKQHSRFGFIGKKWMHNVHCYCLSANRQYFE
jgi:hypothetical protein